jgi:hypothetical protein
VAEWRERSLAQALRCAPTTLGLTLISFPLGREADCTPDRILPPRKRFPARTEISSPAGWGSILLNRHPYAGTLSPALPTVEWDGIGYPSPKSDVGKVRSGHLPERDELLTWDGTRMWDGIGTPGRTLGRDTLILYRGPKLYRP